MSTIVRFLPSIICSAAAGILALKGGEGWGLLLFAAVLMAYAGAQA